MPPRGDLLGFRSLIPALQEIVVAVEPVYLTEEGKEKLETELELLAGKGRREIANRLEFAKGLGDISESGEFEDAKRAQEQLERRVGHIQRVLGNHVLVGEEPRGAPGTVQIGSKVTVRDGEDQDTYELVGHAEASPREGKISYQSPMGAALLGATAGDTVRFEAPAGQRSLQVIAVD